MATAVAVGMFVLMNYIKLPVFIPWYMHYI